MTGTYARRVPGKAADIANLAVIIDPMSLRQPALAKVLTLAIRLDAAVGLLTFDSAQLRELRLATEAPGRSRAPPSASLRAWLDHFSIPLRARGIDVITQVLSGDPPHDSLLRWLQQSSQWRQLAEHHWGDLFPQKQHHLCRWRLDGRADLHEARRKHDKLQRQLNL